MHNNVKQQGNKTTLTAPNLLGAVKAVLPNSVAPFPKQRTYLVTAVDPVKTQSQLFLQPSRQGPSRPIPRSRQSVSVSRYLGPTTNTRNPLFDTKMKENAN